MMLESNNFLRGITIEENPCANEVPAETAYFDMSGNEVSIDVNE